MGCYIYFLYDIPRIFLYIIIMGQIRLYRKIYCVSQLESPVYTLVNAYNITASSYVAGSGATESNTIVESNTSVTQESTGIYYTDLNPVFYATDITYDLVWYIKYTSTAPVKKLTTRFKLNNQSHVSSEIDIEILNQTIEFEVIDNNLEIDIEISNQNIEIIDNNLEIDIL